MKRKTVVHASSPAVPSMIEQPTGPAREKGEPCPRKASEPPGRDLQSRMRVQPLVMDAVGVTTTATNLTAWQWPRTNVVITGWKRTSPWGQGLGHQHWPMLCTRMARGIIFKGIEDRDSGTRGLGLGDLFVVRASLIAAFTFKSSLSLSLSLPLPRSLPLLLLSTPPLHSACLKFCSSSFSSSVSIRLASLPATGTQPLSLSSILFHSLPLRLLHHFPILPPARTVRLIRSSQPQPYPEEDTKAIDRSEAIVLSLSSHSSLSLFSLSQWSLLRATAGPPPFAALSSASSASSAAPFSRSCAATRTFRSCARAFRWRRGPSARAPPSPPSSPLRAESACKGSRPGASA